MTCGPIADLSHNNPGLIDFAAARRGGLLGVILKASQGIGFRDPVFFRRFANAEDAGLLAGAYHFLTGNDAPEAQMNWFLECVSGPPDGVLLAIDLERDTIGGETSATPAQAAEAALCLERKIGRLPLIYTGRYGPQQDGSGFPNETLTRCGLWLPEYGSQAICPAGWPAWALWQYTDTGSIAGMAGKVDLSRYAGAPADLAAWWGR